MQFHEPTAEQRMDTLCAAAEAAGQLSADALLGSVPGPSGPDNETLEALWDRTATRDDRVLAFGRAVWVAAVATKQRAAVR